MKIDSVMFVFRIYKLRQITKNKWKLGIFIFTFLDDEILVTGHFPYSLAKQICSTNHYLNDIFASTEKEKMPFKYFLSNSIIENYVRDFSLAYSTYNRSYEDCERDLIEFKCLIVDDFISNDYPESLFLEKVLITSIPALVYTISCIINFYTDE